jgi:serine/threonine protein kinase
MRPNMSTHKKFPDELPESFTKSRFAFVKWLGHGSYGWVFEAWDKYNRVRVAIKWIPVTPKNSRNYLQEIELHTMLQEHANILRLRETIVCNTPDVMLVIDLMECDLRTIMLSNDLTMNHRVTYARQILKGLAHMHDVGILHRDLTPSNILGTSKNHLVICDFGQSRKVGKGDEESLTMYVTTRWYRAPEICGCFGIYDEKADVWSVGCILAELLLGRPLFQGKNTLHQLQLIIDLLGMPEPPVLERIRSERTREFLCECSPGTNGFDAVFPPEGNDEIEIDCIRALLTLDPNARLSAKQALQHPYFKETWDRT